MPSLSASPHRANVNPRQRWGIGATIGGAMFGIVFMGCEPLTTPRNTTTTTPNVSTDSNTTSPTNSGVNVRDRDSDAKTPIDQNENQKDINITADIRKQIVATDMSTNAHNVKIITQDGKTTLRGPVDSEDEKTRIEKIAQDVAGKDQVDNQIEVTPK